MATTQNAEQFVLKATIRNETGKKAAKHLRAEGKIPAVVYDEAGKATSITVNAAEFNKIWRTITATTLITLDVDGKKTDAFIRDTEYNIISDAVLHADFFAVTNTKPVTRKYKVQLSGTAAGVLKGGFLVRHTPEIIVKALPRDLPVRVVGDISKINIGDLYKVSDLGLSDKVTLITPADTILVTIAPAR